MVTAKSVFGPDIGPLANLATAKTPPNLKVEKVKSIISN
jgi:hypothetical protein